MNVRIASLCAVAALAVGCLSVGQSFEVQNVRQLEIGVTHRKDVLRLFGPPWRTGVEDGLATWTYGDYRYSLFASEKARDLVVRFGPDGVVRSYGFNSTYAEDRAISQ